MEVDDNFSKYFPKTLATLSLLENLIEKSKKNKGK